MPHRRSMLRSRTGRLFAATLLVLPLLLASASRPTAAQEAAGAFRFIPAEAFAAVVAYPKEVADQPEMELLPKEVITAAGLKELGLDPLDIEQFVAFMEGPSDSPLPAFGAVIRFSKPVDQQKLLPPLMANTQKSTLNGKPFFQGQAPFLPSVMLPNDRTVVIAPEATLTKMMSGKAADSPLLKILRGMPKKHHLSVVATIDPIRPLIDAQLAQAPPLPPPFSQFLKIPNHVSALELHVDVAGAEAATQLIAHSPNANSASELHQLLGLALELAKQAALAQTARGLQSEDPIEQAAAKYAERMLTYVQKTLAPKLDGNKVSMEVKGQFNTATAGVAVALLLPAVQAAREAARRTAASNNLRQIALAMHNYHDTYGKFPPRANLSPEGKPLLSWRVHILPYIEQAQLYQQFKLDEPWDSEHNRKLIDKMPSTYRVPGAPATSTKTNYLMVTGKGTLYEKYDGVSIAAIVDGTSNTLMAVEVSNDRAVTWTKPDDYEVNFEKPLDGLIGIRVGGFQAAFIDGSVRFISQNTDPATLKALYTRGGGEAIRLP